MAYPTGREALQEIGVWAAGQVGLDSKDVSRIVVDLNCNDLVYARVNVYLVGDQVNGFKERLKRYKLVPLAAKADCETEAPLRHLVDIAERVAARWPGFVSEPADVGTLRKAAERMREIVPKEDEE